MRKTLRSLMLVLTALICSAASAQDVVLNFTNAASDWGIKATSAAKEKGTKTYSNGTYEVTIAGDGKNGFAAYAATDKSVGYVLFGKQGASITLPTFDFPVGVVQFIGRNGASTAAKLNVFVGDQAICKETVGSVGTNNYFIPEAYQSGKQFTIKLTSDHNAQVTKINIFKVGNPDAPQPEEEKPLVLVGNGSEENPYTVADIKAIHAANKATSDAVWVKGVIAGNIDTGNDNKLKVPVSGTDAVASNLAITEGELFASVQLVNESPVRKALNIQEHFNYIGTEVAVHGTIEAYCGMAGVKNLDDYRINAPETQKLPENYVPAPVDNFTATWVVTEDGKNNVEISFNAPTEMINEVDWSKSELSAPITKIELQLLNEEAYEWETIRTFYYPTAGEELKWTVKDLQYGSYSFMAQVYVDEAMDWANPEEVIVGQLPADIEYGEFTATVDEADPYKVILEVTLPSTDNLGEPLTMPITKVEFGEMGSMSFEPEVFYTEDAEEVLVPGTKLQYIVEKATDGLHNYSATVYTAAGCNFPAMAEVFVGKDQPGRAENIQAQVTEEGILVTWEAPTEGLNGGDMGNVADITYTVARGADQYDESAVVIAQDIKELQILDKTEFTEESKFVYIITAKSPYGEGYPTCSNEIVVGPASQLPFSENFDASTAWGGTTTEHSTWGKDFSGYFCSWQIGQSTYINDKEIAPHNGNGLLYAYYSPWGTLDQWDSYTTGNIDFTEADAPVLTFWLYDLAQGGSPVTLKIQTTTDDTEFATAETINIGKATEEGWREVTVSLDALKNVAKGKVRFLSEANGENCVPVVIDEILIKNDYTTGISTMQNAERGTRNYYNLAGQRVDNNAKGIIIKNGVKVLVK